MDTSAMINVMLSELKRQVVSRPYIVRQLAEHCLGWPYVFASQGQSCTPKWRKSRIPQCREQKYADMIRNDCPVLSDDQKNCDGCQWEGVNCFDCAGFVEWLLRITGVPFFGTGATTQWNTASNWAVKGKIGTMPKDLVCCVYKWSTDRMIHAGMSMGDGKGGVIHCSGTVKRGNVKTDVSPWTHWGIPRGLYSIEELRKAGFDVDESKNIPTLRRGSSGDEVKKLQSLLNDKSGAGLNVDGNFGAKTEAAVKEYQKNNGLTVDGIVGAKTWASLGVFPPESIPLSNADIIWETLYNALKNPYSVAGLMGNLYAESSLNPKNLQSTGNNALGMTDEEYTEAVDNGAYSADKFVHDGFGYGLAQWTYSTRKKALLDFVSGQKASIGDLKMQLYFLLDELRFSYSGVWYSMLNASSVREASDAVLLNYERPKNQSEENQQRRAELGQKFFDQFADISKTTDDGPMDGPVGDPAEWDDEEAADGVWIPRLKLIEMQAALSDCLSIIKDALNR